MPWVWNDKRFVLESDYDRVVKAFQERLREMVEFAEAHGLTQEMFEAWKANKA